MGGAGGQREEVAGILALDKRGMGRKEKERDTQGQPDRQADTE